MEEKTVELYDYLRVIWKRKIHIIVLTLLCIGVGVAVKNSKSKLPPVTTYQSEVVIRIGQKLAFAPSTRVSSTVAYIESPMSLVVSLPISHAFNISNTNLKASTSANSALGYNLDVEQIGGISILKLILSGPDTGVERALREIVNTLIDRHRGKTESSTVAFASFIKKLEGDAIMIQENIALAEKNIKEIKRRGGVHLENMVAVETEMNGEKSSGGQSAFMNMLYLKTIDLERELRGSRNDLRSTQWQLVQYQTSVGDRRKYNTEIIGKIKNTSVVQSGEKARHSIIIAGVAGLITSLFMVFFMEYIEESKVRRKRKK